tara:strand:- start:139 stop:957 length:819 start_codon:yes stop_codon:yes gene_type:complete
MANMQDQIKQLKAEQKAKEVKRERGNVFTVGDQKYIKGQGRELLDGTKVRTVEFFGNKETGKGSFYVTRISDGRKMKVRQSDIKPAGKGAPGFVETKKKNISRGTSEFQEFKKSTADVIAQKIDKGEIKTKAQLRDDPDYKKIKSKRIKSEMIRVLAKKGGDVSYKPVVKPEVKKKSAGSFAPEKLAKIKKGAGAGTSRGPDGVIQIQEPLLLDRKTIDAMSDSEYFRTFKKSRFSKAKGGIINARNGAFIEVQNRFSDRMLPGKKRTTRIY